MVATTTTVTVATIATATMIIHDDRDHTVISSTATTIP